MMIVVLENVQSFDPGAGGGFVQAILDVQYRSVHGHHGRSHRRRLTSLGRDRGFAGSLMPTRVTVSGFKTCHLFPLLTPFHLPSILTYPTISLSLSPLPPNPVPPGVGVPN